MNYQDFGLKIKFLNIKNLISNIKMDQNSGLKAPKKLACLLVKKCSNNGQELGNFKLITLYATAMNSSRIHHILVTETRNRKPNNRGIHDRNRNFKNRARILISGHIKVLRFLLLYFR